MPSQPSARVDLPLRRPEWDLLVRLPGDVLVAAAGDARVDAVAGVEAIASGHRARSLLVRGVVATIFAEQPAGPPSGDRPVVLAECRAAARLLADRLGADDARAYGEWLLTIAASVGAAAWQTRAVHFGGVAVFVAERRFLEQLRRALRP